MRTLLVLAILFLTFLPGMLKAQKIFVEKIDNGAEQVIINKMIEKGYHITFNLDSADYILKGNIKRMPMGRAKGNILIVDAKSGELVSKTKGIKGKAHLMNGYDNPVADVLKKTAKKYLFPLLSALPTQAVSK